MRRTPLLALPAVAVALGAAALAPSASGATAAGPTFGVPRVVDPIHVYGEPNLEVNPKTHAVHATGPQGTGTQRSIWNVSVDNGDSYRIVQNLPANVDQAASSAYVPTKSALGPGGGDTEIKIAHNGQAFFNDLAALASFTAVTTTDDGKTTSTANPLAIGTPGGDRQWMALFDPLPSDNTISPYKGKTPLNYMEYADQVNGDAVDMSTDGVNYTVAGEYGNDGSHNPNHGVPLVDQHTGKFLGMTTGKSGNSLALVVGVPNAAGLLTFHYNEMVSDLVGNPETLFPVLAQDGARNLYAVWVDGKNYQTWYSWAPPGADNEWKSWAAPRQLSAAPANTNLMPWVAASKAPGIIDVAWYGTDKTLKELGSQGPSAKANQKWDLFFAQVDNAASSTPHVAQVKAAPHPMHYNDICMLGTACITAQGNRNQADFFKLIVDPFDGRARIIYTDSSNRLSQTMGMDTAADHQGAALDTVVTQNTGLSALTGAPLTPYESTAPVSSWTDPAGDALMKPLGGTKVPGADITSVSMKLDGSDVVVNLKLADALGTAAIAGGTPTAQAVVRWQMGDTLYFVAAEATPAGPLEYYGGKTDSVDLCSVSGCKPNYLTYNAFPNNGVAQGTGSADGGTIQIKVPASALGNPTASSLLEEAMAFVVASPQSGVVPQNNGTDFTDQAPLQLEGTRTVNVKLGANAVAPPVVVPPAPGPGGSGGGNPSANPPSNGGNLAATGLSTGIPAAALLLVIGALFIARRRRTTP
ncbi:MAG: hypothetical protein QOI82_1952 [Actinomycetota bacterium]|nr:hypothetical protein [Actinomycetota bacterium]